MLVPGSSATPTFLEEQRWKKERQTFALLTLLSLALIFCWVPWFVYSILSTYTGFYDWLVYMVTYWICYSLSAVNPLLFNFVNPYMKQTVKRILTGKLVAVRNVSRQQAASARARESSTLRPLSQ